MKFRWTISDAKNLTDKEILKGLVAERHSTLNPYTPFAQRLNKLYHKLAKEIMEDNQK